MVYTINPFVNARRILKNQLYELIKKNKELSKEQIIALFSLQTGLKRSTINEYWQELEEAGLLNLIYENSQKGGLGKGEEKSEEKQTQQNNNTENKT
jgi:hypothetical protein